MAIRVVEYDEPLAFLEHVQPLLLEHEAENNLPLGVSAGLARGLPRPQGTLLCAIEDGGAVTGVALMTPPHELVLSKMDARPVQALAGHLRENDRAIPGVVGPSETAMQFARAWTEPGGSNYRTNVSLRIYRLDRVVYRPSVGGAMRPVNASDRELISRWFEAFHEEIRNTHGDVEAAINRRLGEQSLFLWEDGEPVSMAGWSGPTPNGIRINAVYTPARLRRRGYASACVAALSQQLLDSGRKFCFLFTDLSNPTSNKIYQQIGYRPVCDWKSLRFTPLA